MKRSGFILSIIFFSVVFIAISLILGFFSMKILGRSKEKYVAAEPETFTVIIDAGHGGEDGGAVGIDGRTVEKDVNLSVSLYLGRLLEAEGVNVIYTRTEDILLYDRSVDYNGRKKSLDLQARLEIAKKNPNAHFVSIHMNSFGDSKYSGMQVYYSDSADGGQLLADQIQKMSRFLDPSNDRKIKKANSSIFLLNRAPGVAVLVECGFLSNYEECSLLSSDDYQKKVAFAVFRGIMNYKDEKTS